MIDKTHIHKAIGEVVGESGFFLVDVHVTKNNLIQVYLDHMNGISLDDCSVLSKKIEEMLNRDEEDFELQVSSPGLGQPLKVLPQYVKAIGETLEIVLDDESRIRGTLDSVDTPQGGSDPVLMVRLLGTKRNPGPAEPLQIRLKQVKQAKIEIDFNKV